MAGLALRDMQERSDSFYRFSVKCDRLMNMKIEAAARKAGVSATTFVQRHFETIVDEPADDSGFSADVFARQHGVSVHAARLWNVMRRDADPAGVVSGGLREFASAARVSAGHGSDYMAELLGAGLVSIVVRPASRNPGSYRLAKVS
ncbi:hypothetical protein LB519_14845 [Mesorhizobium sp. AD1-1]|uniref:hypothetical protein n=1 Tax=Mesorhizobium sp. AD1-1 TaxID=2876621 RepID=UPI001CCB1FAA|nr:hypothetical protein [Mesorhizobium sp. AD1-1]MBZ9719124.1 hypothetical protein [Mesorhizobium sp. AD1-1]